MNDTAEARPPQRTLSLSDAKFAVFDALKTNLGDLLEGAAEDIQLFLSDIATDIVRAKASGRQDLADELVAQAKVIAATNKVRLGRITNDILGRVIGTASGVLSGLIDRALLVLV